MTALWLGCLHPSRRAMRHYDTLIATIIPSFLCQPTKYPTIASFVLERDSKPLVQEHGHMANHLEAGAVVHTI
jgi:hypothetical protein